jgi:thiol-disulfide isomerase/thioredoxin
MYRLVFLAFLLCPTLLRAEPLPHLGESGQQDFQVYLQNSEPKAFAVAPGGGWGWRTAGNADQAGELALEECQRQSGRRCALYARDNQVVLDRKAWPTLWRPYPSSRESASAATGTKRNQRFPDLRLSPQGRKLSDFKGRVVVLHFWGSWCGPCRKELPELLRFQQSLKNRGDLAFAYVAVRETAATAQAWLRQQKLALTLSDPGIKDGEDTLPLASGGTLHDREVARAFPTTYVLDRQGVVVFSHVGPVPRWEEYRLFLLDLLNHK